MKILAEVDLPVDKLVWKGMRKLWTADSIAPLILSDQISFSPPLDFRIISLSNFRRRTLGTISKREPIDYGKLTSSLTETSGVDGSGTLGRRCWRLSLSLC